MKKASNTTPGINIMYKKIKKSTKIPIKTTKWLQMMNNLNLDNLVHIKITNKTGSETRTTIILAMLNARSVKNKDQIIVEEFNKNRIDIGLFTETMLKDTSKDQAWSNQSRLQTINFWNTTAQPTRQQGGNIITTPKEYQSQVNWIRSYTHNVICNMENYTLK